VPRSVGRVTKRGKVCLEISNLAKQPKTLMPEVAMACGQILEKGGKNFTIEEVDGGWEHPNLMRLG
jgi:hypothetical protein